MKKFVYLPKVLIMTILLTTSTMARATEPVARSLVVECHRQADQTASEVPCGKTTITLKKLRGKAKRLLHFDGSVFTIPVNEDFGRFRIRVQPEHCPKNRDYKTVLAGSVTTLVFEHCR